MVNDDMMMMMMMKIKMTELLPSSLASFLPLTPSSSFSNITVLTSFLPQELGDSKWIGYEQTY